MKKEELDKLRTICGSRDVTMTPIASLYPTQFGKYYDFDKKEYVGE